MSSYSCQSIFRSTSEFTATLQGTSSPGSSQLVENGLQYHGLLCWHRVRADRVWEHRYQKPTANQGLPVVEVCKFKYNGRQLARGDCGLELQSIFRNHGFLFSIFTGLELDQESAEFYCNETNEVSFPCFLCCARGSENCPHPPQQNFSFTTTRCCHFLPRCSLPPFQSISLCTITEKDNTHTAPARQTLVPACITAVWCDSLA